jgi:pyruvate ferredoxin oxidoreductase beta subunit
MTEKIPFKPLTRGFAACKGCTMTLVANAILSGKPDDTDVVIVIASGCFVVATAIFPRTAWTIPMTHVNFETAASVGSGILAAHKVLRRKGRLPSDIAALAAGLQRRGLVGRKFRVIVFAGDGATFDIGLGPLSGMLERGEPIIYICYDNNAYSNTGEQSSGATPFHAVTATTPGGMLRSEKAGGKDLMEFTLSHSAVVYAARTTLGRHNQPNDIKEKSAAAFAHDTGPVLLHIIAPCPRGWGFESSNAFTILDHAIETGECPLYHAEKVGRGHIRHLDYLPERYLGGVLHPEIHPITEFLGKQDRFVELLKRPDWLADYQEDIDYRWLGRHGLIEKCEPYGS